MKSYNNSTLVGRVVRDSEIKTIGDSGNERATFTIAVDRPYKNADGKNPTDFLQIIAWGKLASIVFEYVKKGALVLVSGRIQTRSYESNNETKWITEIVADSVNILEYAKKKDESEPASEVVTEEDVPF